MTPLVLVLLAAGAARAEPLAQGFESLRAGLSARPAAMGSLIDARARGAWFRKVQGPEDAWGYGIRAEGVLPSFHHDPERRFDRAGDWRSGPLDRASVYVGLGSASTEVDAGLVWSAVLDSRGLPTGEFAYRVFWRAAPEGWGHPEKGSDEDLYLRPGEAFAMTLRARGDGTARLDIRRRRDGRLFTRIFPVAGLLSRPRSFKRVHSIDQFRIEEGERVGNERHPAAPTAAWLEGGRWTQTHLLTPEGWRPLTGARATEIRGIDAAARYRDIFAAGALEPDGGEPMVVLPPRR